MAYIMDQWKYISNFLSILGIFINLIILTLYWYDNFEWLKNLLILNCIHPRGVQEVQALIPRQAALIPPPPRLVSKFLKGPLFSFWATDALSSPYSTLPLHIPTGIGWKAYQWTMHLDLKRLGNHCKCCSCTKNQHDAIQHYVKAATSKNFKFGIFELKF